MTKGRRHEYAPIDRKTPRPWSNSTRPGKTTTSVSPHGPTHCSAPRAKSPTWPTYPWNQNTSQLKTLLTTLPVTTFTLFDGRTQIVLAVDESNWLRPDAACTPERAFCHTYARNGQAEMVPGWPYSFITVLQPGASSWTMPLDARRLVPSEDATLVTDTQTARSSGT